MPDPHIIAVVSGKGGVGKTMLSVALANELARGQKTLLFDLDFFNRGLTGLFASIGERQPKIAVSPFPLFTCTDGNAAWTIAEVVRNLFFVCYADLDKTETGALEMTDIASLSRALRAYLQMLAEACGARAIVLDCHGGPDSTSFAACLIADHSLLVSEPDRITLHGTLHFLRMLKRTAQGGELDVRLVFNKVIPAFSSRFLFRFYRDYLQAEFGGRPLLGIYPYEAHLTKAFEKTPFLTAAYPTSQLAKKTRLVLYDLFAAKAKQVLSPAITGMSALTRVCYRYLLGRSPRILNLDFIFRVIAIASLLVFGVPRLIDLASERYQLGLGKLALSDSQVQIVVAVMFLWLIGALVLSWGQELDVRLTYAFRTRAFWPALLGYLTFVVLWALPLYLTGESLHLLSAGRAQNWLDWISVPLAAFAGYLLSAYAWRGIRNIRFDQRYFEGGVRIVFSTAAAVGLGTAALLGF